MQNHYQVCCCEIKLAYCILIWSHVKTWWCLIITKAGQKVYCKLRMDSWNRRQWRLGNSYFWLHYRNLGGSLLDGSLGSINIFTCRIKNEDACRHIYMRVHNRVLKSCFPAQFSLLILPSCFFCLEILIPPTFKEVSVLIINLLNW